VYPDVLLMYFISAAIILLASLALIVQVSLPYNKTGRASVLYNFILVISNSSFTEQWPSHPLDCGHKQSVVSRENATNSGWQRDNDLRKGFFGEYQ
jgi:hypothetical protein